MIKYRRKVIVVSIIIIVIELGYLRTQHKIDIANILSCKLNQSSSEDIRDDVLLSVEESDFSPKNNSIFFHETSRKGALDSRQACAVESAARIHPDRDVYVLFSAPVSRKVLETTCLLKLMRYRNVKLFRVTLLKYAQGTPLATLVMNSKLHNSKFVTEHTSDVERYVTLFRWGGVYLDLDVVVVKSFDSLGTNWIGLEDYNLANPAVIGISKNGVGWKLISETMRELNNTYDPELFNFNGPGAITRVLKRWCIASDLKSWTASKCRGFQVFGPEYFYPLHFTYYGFYFQTGKLSDLIDDSKAYTHHMWNKLSANLTVEANSPYAKLAEKYCPEIFKMHPEKFGVIEYH